jgi:hypothetical protein
MKRYLQLKTTIYGLTIFIFLIQLSGCTSSKIISTNDLPVSSKYMYRIHCKKSDFLLEETVISNGILSGKIIIEESSKIGNYINVYPTSDSVVKINTEMILSLPLANISKIKMKQISSVKTIILLSGITVIVLLVIIGWGAAGVGL